MPNENPAKQAYLPASYFFILLEVGKKDQFTSIWLFFFTNNCLYYQESFFSIPCFLAFAAMVLCVNPSTLPAALKLPYFCNAR